jgi:hypothetical protein
LLFLIYISALLILFLFALLFLPLDKHGLERRHNTSDFRVQESSGTTFNVNLFTSSVDVGGLVFLAYVVLRLLDLKTMHLKLIFLTDRPTDFFTFDFNYYQPGGAS